MKHFLIFLTICLFFNKQTIAQSNNTEAALYNVGLGSVFGGIGAVINKKPNEKFGKTLIKGIYQGAVGGAVVYGSKQLVYQFDKNNGLDKLWIPKIVNAAGVSIIENAAANRNFYDQWHIHIGFNRIEFYTQDKFKIKYRLLPVALSGTLSIAFNSKFSLKYSLQTLTPVFITEDEDLYSTVTSVNSIRIEESRGIKRSLAHEFLHVFQYDDYMGINMFFNTKRNKWKAKHNWVRKINKWIYVDLPGGVVLRSLYLSENINKECHFDNYFEHEANYYSNKYLCRETQ